MTQPNLAGPSLKRAERTSIRISADNAVTIEPLRSDSQIPLLVRSLRPGMDLAGWAVEHRASVEGGFARHGAVLFRGFDVQGVGAFRRVIQALGGEPLEYLLRSTPRKDVGANIYTSTEYPADQEIPMHNENSYTRSWPLKLFFYCEKSSPEGGMTPIAYSDRVYDRISPSVRDRFARKGVSYVRNFGQGADLPWQEVFQTDDKRAVEEYCREAGLTFEWKEGERLRTRQACQGVARHPRTGKMLWFNQAHLFHVSSLGPENEEAMREVFAEADLPRNAYHGDGTTIAAEALEEIREAYRAEQVAFPWEEGDVLLLDNMWVAHGRTPYEGERKIRVGMTDPVQGRDLDLGPYEADR